MADAPERLGRLEWRMDRVEEGVANFRQFQVDAREFFTRHDAREETAEKTEAARHAQNQAKIDQSNSKMNIVLAIATVGLLMIGIATLWVMVWTSKHSQLDPAKIFHSHALEPVLSLNHQPPQEAGGIEHVHY